MTLVISMSLTTTGLLCLLCHTFSWKPSSSYHVPTSCLRAYVFYKDHNFCGFVWLTVIILYPAKLAGEYIHALSKMQRMFLSSSWDRSRLWTGAPKWGFIALSILNSNPLWSWLPLKRESFQGSKIQTLL